jgi:peptidoglycan hydrolase-like protein with peptidoglycan-binding domain
LNRRLKSITCALVVTFSLSVVATNINVGPFNVDVVSAATGTTTPAPAPAKTTTTKPSTTKPATSAPVATSLTRTVAYKSSGSEVKLVQTRLNNKGYKLTVDGIFGKKTLEAVKSFQKKNGLKADGIVGPKTAAKLVPAQAAPATPAPTPTTPAPTTPAPTTPVDVVTTASIVNKAEAFETAISKDGKWIIATLNDLTIAKNLVLGGEFVKTGTTTVSRKIALYTQDDKKNVLERFTLTAPQLTVTSPKARIQGGTFVGDVYAVAADFELVDATVKGNVYVTGTGFKMSNYAKVEGNVYFMNEAAKTSFDSVNTDKTSSVTGAKEMALVDTVTTASVVETAADFEKGITREAQWILATTKDITTTNNLVLDGAYKNGKKDAVTGAESIQRKIALYTQDDKKNVTARFTLTAPKLTILSPNARIQSGTFKGNLYVSALNFQLVDAVVDGNVYFTSQAAKNTFKMDAKSSITGKQFVKTN